MVYSNSCCSCSFEPEIIKIGPLSHKMYSNNILNFQEPTTISNAYTKKSGNLLKAPRIYSSFVPRSNSFTLSVSKWNSVILFANLYSNSFILVTFPVGS